jgi:hypothetical protein
MQNKGLELFKPLACTVQRGDTGHDCWKAGLSGMCTLLAARRTLTFTCEQRALFHVCLYGKVHAYMHDRKSFEPTLLVRLLLMMIR